MRAYETDAQEEGALVLFIEDIDGPVSRYLIGHFVAVVGIDIAKWLAVFIIPALCSGYPLGGPFFPLRDVG